MQLTLHEQSQTQLIPGLQSWGGITVAQAFLHGMICLFVVCQIHARCLSRSMDSNVIWQVQWHIELDGVPWHPKGPEVWRSNLQPWHVIANYMVPPGKQKQEAIHLLQNNFGACYYYNYRKHACAETCCADHVLRILQLHSRRVSLHCPVL